MSALMALPGGGGRASPGEQLAIGASFDAPTLDDVLSHAWETLLAGVPAACPVCGGELEPGLPGGPAGRCEGCGSALD